MAEELASFIPAMVAEQCAAWAQEKKEWKPTCLTMRGAVLFCDISGFTRLTEKFAKEGPDGAEKLVLFLNEYFGKLIALVYSRGGDVVYFAGDAMLAMWAADPPVEVGAPTRVTPDLAKERLQKATLAAAETAREIMARMNRADDKDHPRVHMGLGSGQVSLLLVGHDENRCNYLAVGAPLTQIGPACYAASPDLTVVSREAWQLLEKSTVRATPIAEAPGHPVEGLMCLEKKEPIAGGGPDADEGRDGFALGSSALANALMKNFIPRVVLNYTQEGHAGAVAELRVVTTVFISISGVRMDSETAPLEQVNKIVSTLQKLISHYGGIVNKFILDDKGFLCLCGFGLPPHAHENDAEAAVLAASAAYRMLCGPLGLSASIGITTGRVFCGIVGSPRRREYTVMGDAVNLAARYMTASTDSVLVDPRTYVDAHSRNDSLQFECLGEMTMKGKAEPQVVYRLHALAPAPRCVFPAEPGKNGRIEVVGRAAELALLAKAMDELRGPPRPEHKAGSPRQVVMIEGDAGTGKTRIIEEIIAYAQDLGLKVLQGCGDVLHRQTPLYPWRRVMRSLLELPTTASQDEALATLKGVLAEFKMMHYEADLQPLLMMDDLTGFMPHPPAGAHHVTPKTAEGLLRLIRATSRQQPTILMLGDLQHNDAHSRHALVAAVAGDVQSDGSHSHSHDPCGALMIVCTARPEMQTSTHYQEILRVADLLTLGILPDEIIAEIVRLRIGAANVEPQLLNQIVQSAGGNALFAQELVYSLQRKELVKTVGDQIVFVGQRRDVNNNYELPLPHTLESLIMTRVDRLTPRQLLVYKVASAIGVTFEADLLAKAMPESPEVAKDAFNKNVEHDLNALVMLGLIDLADAPVGPAPVATMTNLLARGVSMIDKLGIVSMRVGGVDVVSPLLEFLTPQAAKKPVPVEGAVSRKQSYRFTSSVCHQVAYRLMLYRELKEYHRIIATWMEHEAQVAGAPPLNAHACMTHWEGAGDYLKMLRCAMLVAFEAYRVGSFLKAKRLLERALRHDMRNVDKTELASVYIKLGMLEFSLGRTEAVRAHLSEALRLIDQDTFVIETGRVIPNLIHHADEAVRRAHDVAATPTRSMSRELHHPPLR